MTYSWRVELYTTQGFYRCLNIEATDRAGAILVAMVRLAKDPYGPRLDPLFAPLVEYRGPTWVTRPGWEPDPDPRLDAREAQTRVEEKRRCRSGK